MANGYLGKISAIVSANTSDFQSKLNGAAKDVQKFASSMQSSLGAAQTKATTSLRGIYTEAQKLERALQAAASGKLSFKGFAGPDLDSAVSRMRAFASVTKEIAGPLSAAAKSFGQLSMEVQGAFNPAIKQAQVLTERLADTINKTGTVSEERFHRISGAVNEAVSAMGRLSEAGKLVGGLASGKELRFQAPQFAAELTRTAALQQQAASLPPSAMAGGDVARLVAAQSQQAAEANRLYAAMENEKQLVGGDVAGATAAYREQLAVLRQVNDQLERRVTLESNIGAKTDISQTGLSSSIAAQRIKEREAEIAKNIGAKTDISQTGLSSSLAARRAKLEAEAAANAKKLEDDRRESDAAARFGAPLASVFETAKLDAYTAKLRILREILIGAGVSAGDAAEEVDEFAAALQNAASKKGGLQAAAAGIAMQEDAAVRAVAAAAPGAGGVKGIRAKLARAGDIGRGGMDKASLALNQLAFAVDDFMSSTGGVEHKLRAISNNVTQLGFVAGGTTGLFVALGAVIAGQAAVALVKWANNGIDAEQQTKALNDALTKQKSLVEQLAQAFESLGDSIAKTAFSEAGGRARQFREELSEIAKKQKELRDSRLFDADPAVQSERARKNQLTKDLEGSQDIGQRVAIAAQLIDAERREKAAKAAVSARGAPDTAAILERALYGISANEFGGSQRSARESAESRQTRLRNDFNNAGNSAAGMIRVLEQRRAERDKVASQNIGPGSFFETGSRNVSEIYRAREDVAQLTRDIETLRAPLEQQFHETLNSIAESAHAAAVALSQAQHEASEAIKDGVPNARLFQAYVENFANDLDRAMKELKAASEMGPEEAGREARVKAAEEGVARVKGRQDATLAAADLYRAARTVDPQRQAEAMIASARGNLSEAGLGSGRIARRLRELEFQRETVRQQSDRFRDPMSARVFQKADDAIAREIESINAATTALKLFHDAIQQSVQELKSNVSSAEQAAQEARRNDLGRSTPETEEARARAERDVKRARREAGYAQDGLDDLMAYREEAVQNGRNADAYRRINEINQQLAAGDQPAVQQGALRAERRVLQNQVQPEIDAFEARARDISDASNREEMRRQSAVRGRELAKTPAQKAADDAAQGAADIIENFNAKKDIFDNLRPEDVVARQKALSLFGRQQMEQAAPMIASMAEEVQNAILQGPSRAALEVKDVSSVEGQKELNRLLRGDDSAKNANIVELEKQNQKLVEVVSVLRDIARNAGIVLDL